MPASPNITDYHVFIYPYLSDASTHTRYPVSSCDSQRPCTVMYLLHPKSLFDRNHFNHKRTHPLISHHHASLLVIWHTLYTTHHTPHTSPHHASHSRANKLRELNIRNILFQPAYLQLQNLFYSFLDRNSRNFHNHIIIRSSRWSCKAISGVAVGDNTCILSSTSRMQYCTDNIALLSAQAKVQ